ncbi:MAG: ABC transporter ATP-binding protein, partial [Phycisphaerales bacterium]|nr:ABC transporter ATP-binding protein [Phycisphaerales bacterium]
MTIEIDGLTAGYERRTVFAGITARAEAGRITTLIGPNAAGKTTLLRCVIGALRPRAGRVRVDDASAHRLRGAELARRLAYVPQHVAVAAAFTVREVVALGRYALAPAPERIEAALTRLELNDVADTPFPALSAGQQQRVGLARAIAQVEPGGHL